MVLAGGHIRRAIEKMPRFNRYLIQGFTEGHINSSPEYFETAFRDSVKILSQSARDGERALQYAHSRILSPEERAQKELESKKCSISTSEFILVEYNFTHEGKVSPVHMYMPYMRHGCLVMNDRRYAIQKAITEKVFSKLPDGIAVRVMRIPIRTVRKGSVDVVSAITEQKWKDFLVLTPLHLKERKNMGRRPPLLSAHYFLAKFGLPKAMAMFGVMDDDVSLVSQVQKDTDEFDYLIVHDTSKSGACEIYVRIRRDLMNDSVVRRFVMNAIAVMRYFPHIPVEKYAERDHVWIWRVALGRFIQGLDLPEALADSHADSHIGAVDQFLDAWTKNRLRTFGVMVDDIYDLLRYCFVELDRRMVQASYQDLYQMRIDVLDGVMQQPMIQEINRRFYMAENRSKIAAREVATLLAGFRPSMISNIHRSPLVTHPSIYNDLWLASCGLFKIRITGNSVTKTATPNMPEIRHHPSASQVESINAFSGKAPGITGLLNPFCPITAEGGIIHSDYAAYEADAVLNDLPYR